MGGMIAQVFASRYAQRTKSLAVIFSSNNQPLLPPPGIKQLLSVITGPPANSSRDAIIDNAVRISRINGSPGYPTPEAGDSGPGRRTVRPRLLPGRDRPAFRRHSRQRQPAPPRQADQCAHCGHPWSLRSADAPVRGRAVARAISGARLVLIDGMGHELPEPVWDEIVGELKTNFASSV